MELVDAFCLTICVIGIWFAAGEILRPDKPREKRHYMDQQIKD